MVQRVRKYRIIRVWMSGRKLNIVGLHSLRPNIRLLPLRFSSLGEDRRPTREKKEKERGETRRKISGLKEGKGEGYGKSKGFLFFFPRIS